MSAENVQTVRALIGRWNEGEMVVRDALHPDVEWIPLRAATEGPYHGIEGMESFAADTRESFEHFELRVEDMLDLGDRVLVWGTIRFRARQSGVEAEVQFGGLVDFRDGKVVRWEDFGSKDAAVEAAGSST